MRQITTSAIALLALCGTALAQSKTYQIIWTSGPLPLSGAVSYHYQSLILNRQANSANSCSANYTLPTGKPGTPSITGNAF